MTACGTILGLPSDTNADPNFGLTSGDGGPQPDVSPLADGFVPEGGPLPDTSNLPDVTVLPDGACNCFGGTCNNNVCQPVQVASTTDPYLIDTDNTSLFVTDNITTIVSFQIANFDAGATTIIGNAHAIEDLKAGNQVVYYTSYNAGTGNNGVFRCPNTAGCPGRLDYANHNFQTLSVAFDSKNVYYTVDENTANGGVWSCPLAGCINGANANQIAKRGNPKRLVTNGTNVAWMEGFSGSGGAQCATNGGSVTTAGQTGFVDLDYGTSGEMYLLTNSSMFRQTGVTAQTYMASNVTNNNGQLVPLMHVDPTTKDVYWLNMGLAGSIVRCPLGVMCTTPTTVAAKLMQPMTFTISNDSIYYTLTDGSIWRLKK